MPLGLCRVPEKGTLVSWSEQGVGGWLNGVFDRRVWGDPGLIQIQMITWQTTKDGLGHYRRSIRRKRGLWMPEPASPTSTPPKRLIPAKGQTSIRTLEGSREFIVGIARNGMLDEGAGRQAPTRASPSIRGLTSRNRQSGRSTSTGTTAEPRSIRRRVGLC